MADRTANRHGATIALALAIMAMTGVQAAAESRAVVIANSDYSRLSDVLDVRPAEAPAAFKKQGFRVVEGRDLGPADMRQAVGDLLRADAAPGPRVVVLMGRFVHSSGETWLLGSDAGTETLMSADLAGLPVSLVIEVMQGGDPHSVLLLGTDQTPFATGPGLRSGIGALSPVPGVTVITGYTDGIGRAAQRLARPGATIKEALAQGQSLRIVSSGATVTEATPGTRPVVVAEPQPRPQPAAPVADPGDAGAWRRATTAHTVAAYREYLGKYPRGAYAAEARRRIDSAAAPRRLDEIVQPGARESAAWASAKRANSVAAYREFLQQYPQSLFAGAARGRMAELDGKPAGDPAAAAEAALKLSRAQRAQIQRQLTLLTYDTEGVDGTFGPSTRRAISQFQRNAGVSPTGYLSRSQIELLGRSARLKAEALEAEARRRQSIREGADTAFWNENRRKGEAGARAYLQRYPDGLYSDKARDVVADAARRDVRAPEDTAGDETAWARASAVDNIASYREYLEKYPRGRHAPTARAKVSDAEKRFARDRAGEASLDLSPQVRAVIEERLNALGLNAGKADGEFSTQTRQALRRYQASRNLRATGYVNQGTIVRLLADTLLGQD